MSWSEEAWHHIEPILEEIRNHPFVKELADGTLPKEKFATYLAQDRIYLANYGQEMRDLASMLPDGPIQDLYRKFAQESIDSENAKNFNTKVSANNFDIYIGETKVSADMNLYTFFSEKGTTHYGIDLSKSKTAKSYESYMKGDCEIGKFVIDFSEEMPFIPLVYRQGMICYSRLIQGDMQGYGTNYFSNIEDWYFN